MPGIPAAPTADKYLARELAALWTAKGVYADCPDRRQRWKMADLPAEPGYCLDASGRRIRRKANVRRVQKDDASERTHFYAFGSWVMRLMGVADPKPALQAACERAS